MVFFEDQSLDTLPLHLTGFFRARFCHLRFTSPVLDQTSETLDLGMRLFKALTGRSICGFKFDDAVL
jgi:hypothetical protein